MLESYFQYQADLAATESALECPEDCSAPGCWRGDVIVEVNLFDLIRLSQVLNTPVPTLFFNHCYLGLQACDLNPRYHRLIIKLKKPCHFLEKSRCAVHGSKPLHCFLFPEYHQIIGHWPKLAESRVFRSFPCIKSEIIVSDERSRALKKLRKISSREEAYSYYFLFGLPSFIFDSKPLTKQLKQAGLKDRTLTGALPASPALQSRAEGSYIKLTEILTGKPRLLRRGGFTLKDYEKLLGAKLKSTGFLDIVVAKISQLDTRKSLESLIAKVQDDVLMEPLLEKKDHPEVVHFIKGNDIKRLKRKVQQPAVMFM